ncbi:Cof-type HAD-IIB family hydrolase [Virgibacillus siamensis]|uniref:Cof-type HAD-IIB family hydrolase n=1 Tax=Virgibacillus siamensis TaxID=480071 RepID=UPI0009861030|nr:Cof-type HAD-IIB family hydrolase [Virgibacillus siamensis]
MSVRAIFIDMDGTLLNASKRISDRNLKAINRLTNRGIKVFLATGRHYEVTAPFHKEIGLRTPMICLNGAAIYEALTGSVMQMRTVQLDDEKFHRLTAENSNVTIHTANGLYCKEITEEIEYWTKVGKIAPSYIGDLRQANYQDVFKYSVKTGGSCPDLSAMFHKEAEVINWKDGFELVAPNVSKWFGIKSLLRAFQINPSEVAAIGDGPNDIKMLQRAGVGAAMANASDEVKAAADIVTGHHEHDGLAEFIESYLIQSYDKANVI